MLASRTRVQAVFTRPPRRQGRGRTELPTPVAREAESLGIPTFTAAGPGDLAGHHPVADLAVVVAFGLIIPAEVLTVPRQGFVNIHFSLLPAWRGAAPVERAILAGDRDTGVCLMEMDEGLDTGGILACRPRAVDRHDAGTLTDLLAADGAALLAEHLDAILDGRLTPRPQEGMPSYAVRLRPEEGRLDPAVGSADLDRRIRAFTPRPGAWLDTEVGRLKVWSAVPREGGPPAGTWGWNGRFPVVGTPEGGLELHEVQAEGSRRMNAPDWANGLRGRLPALGS